MPRTSGAGSQEVSRAHHADDSSQSDRAWDEALTALEHQLAAARVGSIEPLPSWDPPDDLGPLPADLVPRARAVRAAIVELVEVMAAARDATRDEIEAIDRRRDAGHAYQLNDQPPTPGPRRMERPPA